jgi:hypothetical protein
MAVHSARQRYCGTLHAFFGGVGDDSLGLFQPQAPFGVGWLMTVVGKPIKRCLKQRQQVWRGGDQAGVGLPVESLRKFIDSAPSL